MINRRAFLGLATAAPLSAATRADTPPPCTTAPLSSIPVRTCGKVEIALRNRT
jgi:hypothetical protein